MIALRDPPWLLKPRRVFSQTKAQLPRRWYARLPRALAVLVLGGVIRNFKTADAMAAQVVDAAWNLIRHGRFDSREVQDLIERLAWRPPRWYLFDQRYVPNYRDEIPPLQRAELRFLEAVQSRRPSIVFGEIHYELLNAHYEQRVRLSGQAIHINGPRRQQFARQCWAMPPQWSVIRAVQSVFAPPAAFTPTSEAEWLIAADMMEEAGEPRSSAIRAVLSGCDDSVLFNATMHSLPQQAR